MPKGVGRESVSRALALVPQISQVAEQFGIDPLLLHAIAHVESRHNAEAVSHAGARGLMQVMPATARRFGVGDPARTLLDPRSTWGQRGLPEEAAERYRQGPDLSSRPTTPAKAR